MGKRVSVSLDSVLCMAAEDWAADEFYIAGAIMAADRKPGQAKALFTPTPVLTKPLSIDHDQDKAFGLGGGVVFDADVPDTTSLKIALGTYDEDAAKDWNNYQGLVKSLSDGLSAVATVLGEPQAVPVIKAVGSVVENTVKSDADDHLGDIVEDLQPSRMIDGVYPKAKTIQGEHAGSVYRYLVNYTVRVGDPRPDQEPRLVTIKVALSGKMLNIAHAEHENGGLLITYDNSPGHSNQEFWLEPTGDGYVRIIAKHSGKALTVQDGSLQPGAQVIQWTYANAPHQMWKLEPHPDKGVDAVRFVNRASGMYLGLRRRYRATGSREILEVNVDEIGDPDRGPPSLPFQLFYLLPV
ncbi:MAG TPA: RICIN domain-containing protein [Kofleriaceae bacterium]|nr:RICIN domain-containing protein [Kofleriaceae bacterium]